MAATARTGPSSRATALLGRDRDARPQPGRRRRRVGGRSV